MLDPHNDSVFGGSNIVMENTLKNPNEFRDAVLYESLSKLPSKKKKEFIKSKEAKTMVTEGLLTVEMLDRLADEDENKYLKSAICYMAKENGDPIWDEFIKARIQERRLFNELIEKYSDDAKAVVNKAEHIAESNIPDYFKN